MTGTTRPKAVIAAEVPPRERSSSYPEPFASRMEGRIKRPLGDLFELQNFGVNLTTLRPGAMSSLRHAHSRQDELVYILEGAPTLVTNEGETVLRPGMAAGFRAGSTDAHHLVNRTERDVVYLEVGDRTDRDTVTYPDDDIRGALASDGRWRFVHKDGRPY
jgi:uncharacterized cupin superfamily protein